MNEHGGTEEIDGIPNLTRLDHAALHRRWVPCNAMSNAKSKRARASSQVGSVTVTAGSPVVVLTGGGVHNTTQPQPRSSNQNVPSQPADRSVFWQPLPTQPDAALSEPCHARPSTQPIPDPVITVNIRPDEHPHQGQLADYRVRQGMVSVVFVIQHIARDAMVQTCRSVYPI